MQQVPGLSRRATAGGLAATALLGASRRRASAADPVVLRLATGETMNDSSYAVGVRFGQEIFARTGGKYKVQIYVGGALGTTTNLVNSLQTGILDVAMINCGFLESFFPSVQLLDLPFLFRDAASAERILDGEVGDALRAEMAQHNVVGLGWGWYGWRQMQTRVKQVLHPDDLQGLKMRIQPGPVFVAMFKALGAIPVPVDSTEIYLSLSQKLVDGVDFPIPVVVTFKAYEVCQYLALTNHVYNAGALMVSKALWTRLSPAEQSAFRDAGNICTPLWRQLAAKATDAGTAFLHQHGMVISPTDNAEFRAKMTPLYQQFRPKYPALFDKIMALQA